MMTPDEIEKLIPAETASFRSPIPTQAISSDEFMPGMQTPKQKELEGRIKEIGTRLAKHQGVSRRRFFQGAAGMAAAFVAMNDTFGPLYGVSHAEAATPELANERATSLKSQFIMDMHTHYLRDDTRLEGFVRSREAVGRAAWNPALAGKPQTLDDLKFANYFKEIYLDSDTKVALISGSGSITGITTGDVSFGSKTFSAAFVNNRDLYLNGSKLISGINYSGAGSNISLATSDLIDGDILLMPKHSSNLTRYTGYTDNNFNTNVSLFEEQVWINGIRQVKHIDYEKIPDFSLKYTSFSLDQFTDIIYNNDTGFFNV